MPHTAFHRWVRFLLLVPLLAVSGLPSFRLQDVNRDGRVALEDAILNVMRFADSAERPEHFDRSAKQAIATLHAAAGLTTVIAPADDAAAGTGGGFSIPWLTHRIDTGCFDRSTYAPPESAVSYRSLTLSPDAPPPRSV